MPKKKSVDPKIQARLDAKVRPDEPVSDERIYYNMPKKKAPAKKSTKKTTKKKWGYKCGGKPRQAEKFRRGKDAIRRKHGRIK